jgi:hypothetical protein
MDNVYIDKDKLAAQEQQEKQHAPKEKVKEKKPKPSGKKKQSLLLQIVNGEILMRDFVIKNMGFVFFFLFLLLLLVSKGYLGKQLTTDINKSLQKLDATTAEYVEAKAKLEEQTKRYELVRRLEPKGIKETTKPAKVIRIRKKE